LKKVVSIAYIYSGVVLKGKFQGTSLRADRASAGLVSALSQTFVPDIIEIENVQLIQKTRMRAKSEDDRSIGDITHSG
jgi:hypothetical protein